MGGVGREQLPLSFSLAFFAMKATLALALGACLSVVEAHTTIWSVFVSTSFDWLQFGTDPDLAVG